MRLRPSDCLVLLHLPHIRRFGSIFSVSNTPVLVEMTPCSLARLRAFGVQKHPRGHAIHPSLRRAPKNGSYRKGFRKEPLERIRPVFCITGFWDNEASSDGARLWSTDSIKKTGFSRQETPLHAVPFHNNASYFYIC